MQISNQIPNEYPLPKTRENFRTEASEFEANSNSGGQSMPYLRQGRQQNAEKENERDFSRERTLPAIKPGVGPSGGVFRRDVPAFSNVDNDPGAEDTLSPLPMLRRRSEAYERMLNII